jgi:Acetoacetate decarboxylase (ADC)
MAYPPQPWSLRGDMHVSVWAVPVADLPVIPSELAGAVRVVRLGRRALVGAAWVDYQPGGDMTYHELLSSVLMRAGLRPRVTITHIWVDSADSRDGGRELWGIPKDLADFQMTSDAAGASSGADPIASASMRGGLRLPGRWPIGFRVTQALSGKPKTTRVRATARVSFAKVEWHVAPDGPLGFLSACRPMLSVVASGFRMRFGSSQVSASAAGRTV